MSVFSDDAELFLDPDLGAEQIVILPDGETERTVYASVVRRPPRIDPLNRSRIERRVQIRVANNATTGLAMSELVLGKTRVRLSPDRGGGEARTLLVEMPDDGQPWHDEGMIRLFAK